MSDCEATGVSEDGGLDPILHAHSDRCEQLWYGDYAGPKFLHWDNKLEAFVCGLGFNILMPGGWTRSGQAKGHGKTQAAAIKSARLGLEQCAPRVAERAGGVVG